MSGAIEPLLKVQQRRVEKEMANLRVSNQHVLESQLARDAAYSRLCAAQAERQRELRKMADMAAGAVASVRVGDLARTASSLDWWRLRLEQEKKLLEAAELELIRARSALAEAKLSYRREHARQEGLHKLAEERRRELAQKQLRAQELEVEDVLQRRPGDSIGGRLQ